MKILSDIIDIDILYSVLKFLAPIADFIGKVFNIIIIIAVICIILIILLIFHKNIKDKKLSDQFEKNLSDTHLVEDAAKFILENTPEDLDHIEISESGITIWSEEAENNRDETDDGNGTAVPSYSYQLYGYENLSKGLEVTAFADLLANRLSQETGDSYDAYEWFPGACISKF